MLNLARLRALVAVHATGSVRAAAATLGYTPSAVSQQLTLLERETHTHLLERRGRGVVLTPAALMLVATAKRLLTISEAAEAALEEQQGYSEGRLTIAVFASAARSLLPCILAELAAAHSAVDLRIVEVDPFLAVEMVVQGIADIAIAHDWDIISLPAPEDVTREVIHRDRADVIVPVGHGLASRECVTRREITGERWICSPPGSLCHEWLVQTARAQGSEIMLAHQVGEFQTQISLVEAGLGVALLARMGRGPLPPGVVAVPVEPAPVRQTFALWRTGIQRRPVVDQLVFALRKYGLSDPGALGARTGTVLQPDPYP